MSTVATFAIRFKEKPTERQIKHLRFHLIHRFEHIVEWGARENLRDPITKTQWDLGLDDSVKNDERLYEIDSLVMYYSEYYERGPGLDIAGMLLYLCRRPGIEEVYYGGNGALEKYEEKDAIELLNHWIAYGEIPYRLREGENVPMCDWCDMPMALGGRAKVGYRIWHCIACGQFKEVEEK